MFRLSKSQFIRGFQCYKSLWLYKYKPELREEPDASTQATFDTGTEVGILARQLFPRGERIVFHPDKIQDNIQTTKEWMDYGITTIYEAAFLYDDVLVMVDILHKGREGWELYEVKSSTEVKPVHLNDVAIQYYVLHGCGLNIVSASVVHINNQYTRHGDLNPGELFIIADVTEDVLSSQDIVRGELSSMKTMLQDHMPEIDIGGKCDDPYACDFKSHCWSHIPHPSVFDLNRLNTNKKYELYYNGIVKLEDIPENYSLTPAQLMQIESEHDGRRFINSKNIEAFLQEIAEPIGFMDFETFQEAIPFFNNQRPYQQIPFQYSLHILHNEQLEHFEYLAETGKDPRGEFIQGLIKDTDVCRSILVFNQGFENSRLRELAQLFPEHAQEIHRIIDRVVDLMRPFQNKDYYVKEMQGSYSIKKVLPALMPEMSYDQLEISDGGMAMQAYANLKNLTGENERMKVREALLKYCEMDTLAMVMIWEKLIEIAHE